MVAKIMGAGVLYRILGLEASEERLDITINPGSGYQINYDGALDITIQCFALEKFERNFELGDFSAFVARVPGGLTGGAAKIKYANSTDTIGYIFSIETLADPSADFDLFPAGYAKAAIEKVLLGGVGFEFVDLPHINTRKSVIDFQDFFENHSMQDGENVVAVVSKRLCPDIEEVKLSISRFGARFFEYDGRYYSKANFQTIESLSCRTFPRPIEDKKPVILSLLKMAGEQPDPFSRFASLYQIIEILIDYVFKKELERFIKHAHEYDSWKSRDKLTELAKEKKRIALLSDHYFNNYASISDEFPECTRCSGRFIVDYVDGSFESRSWAANIYKVRNSVTHARAALLLDSAKVDAITSDMDNVSSLFLKCCIALVLGLKKERS